MKIGLIAALAVLPLTGAFASDKEYRDLGEHAHGHGKFNVAVDGRKLIMELEVPGADVVGFEHKAGNDAQSRAIAEARKRLSDVTNIVALPTGAGCALRDASVEFHVEGESDEEHKHDEEEESHAEFHAEYELTCSAPDRLTGMTFTYFRNFERTEELEVTVIGPKKQLRLEVDRDDPEIDLEGVM